MKRNLSISLVLILVISLFSITIYAASADNSGEGLITLNVKDLDARDVLRLMGEQSGMNIVPDSSVRGQVTLTLNKVTAEQALEALFRVYKYYYEKVNENTYIISQQTLTEPYLMEIVDGRLTLIAQAIDIKRILNDVGTIGNVNIIYDQSVNGQINANLIEVDFVHGLKTLCSTNNLLLLEREGIYSITSSMAVQQGRQMAVSYSNGLVSIDAKNGDLSELIRAIAEQAGINIVLYGGNHQLVDMKIENVPVDEAIGMIISGTRYAFKKVNGVYLIGDKSINSPSSALLTTNEVINLKYLQAEKVPAMLPNTFPATNIKVIKELNALAVVGTKEEVEDLKGYLAKIDKKIPQIVIEALVVEFNKSKSHNPVLNAGLKYNGKDTIEDIINLSSGKLGYTSALCSLTPEFYLNLSNLVEDGYASVKSRPKITTLNGFQAKINVGQVLYYKVDTPASDDQPAKTQYQTITAGVILDVTPWVSSSDEVTLELHPNISNTGIQKDSAPPPVAQRQIDTTVRVKSGETLVLGGLISENINESLNKVPFFGDIPIIGKLFQSTTYGTNQTELVIFITPHILPEGEESVSQDYISETIEDMSSRMGIDGN